MAEGLGAATFGADDYNNSLKAYLDHNVYAFSGAKSLVMLQEFNRLLTDENGEILPFSQFKQRVQQIDELYNKTYLAAEYDNAIASAQMAEKWQGLTKFKYLEYRTVGDDRVRPAHAALDGLILKSVDPLWNKIYPPNGWHCRCTVIPAADSDTPTDRDHAKALTNAADIQPYFKTNVGKDRVVFRDDHPYFKNGRYGKLKELDAEKNYGMSGMDRLYASGKFPAIDYMGDKIEALNWWKDQAGEVRGSFDVKSADGLSITFDNAFRKHVLEQNSDDRFKILHLAPQVVQKPDEIWSRLVGGKASLTYIKYYDSAPVVVHVDAEGTVRGTTLVEMQHKGKINIAEMIKIRKGVLKFKQ